MKLQLKRLDVNGTRQNVRLDVAKKLMDFLRLVVAKK